MRLVDRVIARKGTRLYETGPRAQLDLCPLVCNHSVRGSHLTFEIPLLLAIPLAAPVVSPVHPILLLTQLPDSPDGSTVMHFAPPRWLKNIVLSIITICGTIYGTICCCATTVEWWGTHTIHVIRACYELSWLFSLFCLPTADIFKLPNIRHFNEFKLF